MTPARKGRTMADVARLAGVSPMTVSRAFKADSSVSQATRGAILKAADDLGYVFDSTASNLRSQRTDFVAVTIPSISNADFADTVRGLSDGLKPLTRKGVLPRLARCELTGNTPDENLLARLRQRPEVEIYGSS